MHTLAGHIDTYQEVSTVQETTNVLRFPTTTRQRVDRAALEATRALARLDLIEEGVAVRTLQDLGAGPEECDLWRTLYAVRKARR